MDFYYSITENEKGSISISFVSLYLKLSVLQCETLESSFLSIRKHFAAVSSGAITLPSPCDHLCGLVATQSIQM